MRAIVLGSAAGGGFPQWNSHSQASVRARSGDPTAKPRTQAGLAVSVDEQAWFLINAAPDLRQQIDSTPHLQPKQPGRSSPICGVVLTSGEVDAIAGLLTLRERQPLTIYATQDVLAILAANSVFDVLAADIVQRVPVALDTPFTLLPPGGTLHITCTLFPVPSKAPLYLEGSAGRGMTLDGKTVGVQLSDGTDDVWFVPGCAAMTPALSDRLRGADCVLFDGTLWRDDEMLVSGMGNKTGTRMGHMSVSGPDGVIAAFEGLDVKRRVFVHINNTNPILLEDSAEHAAVREAGWEVAFDGMELFA